MSRLIGTLLIAEGLLEIARKEQELSRVRPSHEEPRRNYSEILTMSEFDDLLRKVSDARMGYELAPIKAVLNKGAKFSSFQIKELMGLRTFTFSSDREKLLVTIGRKGAESDAALRHAIDNCFSFTSGRREMYRKLGL